MVYYKFSVIYFLVIISFIQANDDRDINKVVSADGYDIKTNIEEELVSNNDVVRVQFYYECMCAFCRKFSELLVAISSLSAKLNPYLDIEVYPYGIAETKVVDGKYVFTCQHGPAECYGNMLHACAIDQLKNLTLAISYNSCMMLETYPKSQGSDDKDARQCGLDMKIDSEPIIACAKGDRGLELLNYYGELSKKANFDGVPYILINGKEFMGKEPFDDAICAAFKKPPPPAPCNNLY